MGHDAPSLHVAVVAPETARVVPTDPTQACKWPVAREPCKRRHRIERVFIRLNDVQGIAIRYGKITRNDGFAAALVAAVIGRAD